MNLKIYCSTDDVTRMRRNWWTVLATVSLLIRTKRSQARYQPMPIGAKGPDNRWLPLIFLLDTPLGRYQFRRTGYAPVTSPRSHFFIKISLKRIDQTNSLFACPFFTSLVHSKHLFWRENGGVKEKWQLSSTRFFYAALTAIRSDRCVENLIFRHALLLL